MRASWTTMLAVCVSAVSLAGVAAPTAIDFEDAEEGATPGAAAQGVTLAHARVVTAGVSLNQFEFPPASGTKAAVDHGAPVVITFEPPVTSFGAFYSYAVPLRVEAFDSAGRTVGLTQSRFGSNRALSGDPGSAPNEFIGVGALEGIASLRIAGAAQGSSFTLDDALVSFDSTAPSTVLDASPPASSIGWHPAPVRVSLTAHDPEPGTGVRDISVAATGAYNAPARTVAGATASLTVDTDGQTVLTYFARDNAGNAEAARTAHVRVDSTPPMLTCRADPQALWPPNHQMVPVVITVDVRDAGSGPAGFELISATSSDGTTGDDDIAGFQVGSSSITGSLRAERSGEGSRIYTLRYRGRDVAGHSALCDVNVVVPHDQGAGR